MKETLIETLQFLLEQARINAGPGPVAHAAQNLADRITAHVDEEAAAEPGTAR